MARRSANCVKTLVRSRAFISALSMAIYFSGFNSAQISAHAGDAVPESGDSSQPVPSGFTKALDAAIPSDFKSFASSPSTPAPASSGGGSGEAPSSGSPGPCDTPEGARACVAQQGYTKEAQQIKTDVDSIVDAADAAVSAQVVIPNLAQLKALQKTAASYAGSYDRCVSRQNRAADWCQEKNPKTMETISVINMLAGGFTALAVKDACSTMGKIMEVAQLGLTGFVTACSTVRAQCELTCSGVMEDLTTIKAQAANKSLGECIPDPITPLSIVSAKVECQRFTALVTEKLNSIAKNAANDANLANNKSTALKSKACTYEYTQMVLSAGTGIMSMVKTLAASTNCDNKSNGVPAAKLALAADQCANAENKNTPVCLCASNPRMPGCDNTLSKLGQTGADSGGVAGLSNANNPGPGSSGASNGLGSALAGDSTSTPSNGHSAKVDVAGAPVGGSAGGSGALGGSSGDSGGAGGNPASDTNAKSALNANIFGGAGGGGGGGGWGGRFPSAASDQKSQYTAYLPGGEKDPLKISGQQAWKKEITGEGGKSNWDKVRERYRDINATLLEK